ncbi:MAG: polyamine ABC transporter ATP-binding protein [Holosporales bacterium]|nr:polyamine ABC transporter ATP-binding protein [Holosporales bacterium]
MYGSEDPLLSVNRREDWQILGAEPFVSIKNISKSFNGVPLIRDVSISVFKNELFSLLGCSGCGKTTLLRILAGFDKPSSGKIIIDGIDVTDVPVFKRPVNMMFQSYALFPHLTVYDNIAFGLKQDKLSKTSIADKIGEIIKLTNLTGLEKRMPDQLSGGQKQRVALARSLVKRPKLLLLDEPMAALDKSLREQTQFELVNIQERIGITFILVTHDQEEAMTMSSRMAIMEEGKIKQIGAPHDVYEFPNSKFVAEFVGRVNFFDGIVLEHQLDQILIESNEIGCFCNATHAGAVPVGTRVTCAVRPEKIMISTLRPAYPRNWVKGVIKEIAYLGHISTYHVLLNSGKVVVVTLPNLLRLDDRNFQWEDEVYLFWRSENSMVLTV